MLDTYSNGMSGRIADGDEAPARALGRELFAAGPVTIAQLKAALAERFPDSEPQALANLSRLGRQLLIQPDFDAPYAWKVNAPFVDAHSITGARFAPPDDEHVVRRFLQVLGPGSAKDAQTWSGVRRLRPVMERMHDQGELITLTTWEGDELYDLPHAPRPSGDTPVPPRFLPTWDNLLLSHADRSRVIDPAHKPYLASKNGMPPATYLIDGFVHGTWKASLDAGDATLVLTPFDRLPGSAEGPLVTEGTALLAFLHPDAPVRTVRVA